VKRRSKVAVIPQHLVSLNTARIKLRGSHPRISQDLEDLFGILKAQLEAEEMDLGLYQEDGLIDVTK
jgi:hypothetical protein